VLLLVQCTSIGHVADRVKKARSRPELLAWLKAGGWFVVMGWTRRGGRWAHKDVEVLATDLAGAVIAAPPQTRAAT
jgi:hypothetical protein